MPLTGFQAHYLFNSISNHIELKKDKELWITETVKEPLDNEFEDEEPGSYLNPIMDPRLSKIDIDTLVDTKHGPVRHKFFKNHEITDIWDLENNDEYFQLSNEDEFLDDEVLELYEEEGSLVANTDIFHENPTRALVYMDWASWAMQESRFKKSQKKSENRLKSTIKRMEKQQKKK